MTVLQAIDISKSFGAFRALHQIDFELQRGEVMALLGENGAGKSTFVKIIAGLETPSGGELRIGGQRVALKSPVHALHCGVAYVTQETSIVGTLSVAENVCLGGVGFRGAWTSKRLVERARPFLAMVGLDGLGFHTTSRAPIGSGAPACGNREAALAGSANPHSRRTNRRTVRRRN